MRAYGFTDYQRRMIAFLERRLPSGRPRVLEAAVGTGEPFAAALARRTDFWGIDVAETLLAEAARALPGSRFAAAEAERLPFPEGCFDFAYCLQSSWCLRDVGALIRELARVLRPGGSGVVDLMNAFNPRVSLAHVAMRARAIVTPWGGGYMRERGCDPWRVLATLPDDCRGELRRADDPDRAAGRLASRLDARLVLAFEKG